MENDDGLVQVPDENPLRSPGQSGGRRKQRETGRKRGKINGALCRHCKAILLVNRPGACFCAPQGPGIHLLGPVAATLLPTPRLHPPLCALCITVINSDKLIN